MKSGQQNTNKASASRTQTVVLFDNGDSTFNRITLDAVNYKVVMEVIDSAGARVTTEPSLELDLNSTLMVDFAAAADPTDKHLTLRETKACDEAGTACYVITPRTKFYYTAIGSDFA